MRLSPIPDILVWCHPSSLYGVHRASKIVVGNQRQCIFAYLSYFHFSERAWSCTVGIRLKNLSIPPPIMQRRNRCTPFAKLENLPVNLATCNPELRRKRWHWALPTFPLQGWRPPGLGGGIKGSINSNWAWFRLLEYALLMTLSVLYLRIYSLCSESFFTHYLTFQTTS